MSIHETAYRHGYAFSRDEGGAPKPSDPSLAQAWQRGFDAAEEEKERERNYVPTQRELNEPRGKRGRAISIQLKMKPQNPEAFPTSAFDPSTGHLAGQSGMTLRDYFAAKVMQGFAVNGMHTHQVAGNASFAYEIADAMLAEREKETP